MQTAPGSFVDAASPPLPADFRRVLVPFLEPDAAVDVVVECAAGDGAVDVLDESTGTVGHASMVALG